MEIGLLEIGLKQLLARKYGNYVDRIDKITTCSIVRRGVYKVSEAFVLEAVLLKYAGELSINMSNGKAYDFSPSVQF